MPFSDRIWIIKRHEAREAGASMTMEQIFKGTKSFKQAVFENVQLELNKGSGIRPEIRLNRPK
jgi:hypothetical protein